MKLKILITTALAAALFQRGGLLLAGWNGGFSLVEPASIYGTDDREDAADSDAKMQALSTSVVALFLESSLSSSTASGAYAIVGARTLGDSRNMAPGQRFTGQVRASYCSGALVGDDLVFTAAHCLKESGIGQFDCAKDKLVFGFAVTQKGGSAPMKFPKTDVYGCKKIVAWKLDEETKSDYAVIRLDGKAARRTPLAINRKSDLKTGDGLFVIGYPDGLPLKIAKNGKVRSMPEGQPYFFTDLDTFHGNSGSPVFNARTFRIEGILVRGDRDYVRTSSGTMTAVYPQEGGAGEEATKISEIKDLLPVTKFEKYLDYEEQQPARPSNTVKPVPAIYIPGSNAPTIQPAIYYPDPVPTRVDTTAI